MAPKEPDWAFLETIDPEDLDDEKADQVKYYYECLSLNFYVWIKRQRLDVKEENNYYAWKCYKTITSKILIIFVYSFIVFCSNNFLFKPLFCVLKTFRFL